MMKNIINQTKEIWNDESAQGATEYILVLVAVVTVALIFKDKIKGFVTGKLDDVQGGLDQIKVD